MLAKSFLVVPALLLVSFSAAVAEEAAADARRELGVELLSRRNPSLRSGIVSIRDVVTVSGAFGDPSTETNRRVYFDRDQGLVRIEERQRTLSGEGQGETTTEEPVVIIRTPELGIIKHARAITLMRVEDVPAAFDPLAIGLHGGTAMEDGARRSDFRKQFAVMEKLGGRAEVSVSEIDAATRVVTINLIFPPHFPRVARRIYWLARDRGDVPVRYVVRELKRLEDGTLEPLGPDHIESEVSWELSNGAYIPRQQTITERLVNASGEVIGEKNFALTFDWEMINQEIEDESMFSEVSLDIPKGSHDIVDSRSGTSIVIQNPRIPSAAMLAAQNEELRVRRSGEPELLPAKRSRLRRVLIAANVLALLVVIVVYLVRGRRRAPANSDPGKPKGG